MKNIAALDTYVTDINTHSNNQIKLRPHSKTHKCPNLASLVINSASSPSLISGICCQKLDEVSAMVHSDVDPAIDDILITNQIVGIKKLVRLGELMEKAGKDFTIAILVDNYDNLLEINDVLSEFADAIGKLGIYIEINGGQNRGGLNIGIDDAEIVKIAAFANDAVNSKLEFCGVHCYGGWLQHVREPGERDELVQKEVVGAAGRTVELLRENGIEARVVTGAGTGSFKSEVKGGVHNELQVSFIPSPLAL